MSRPDATRGQIARSLRSLRGPRGRPEEAVPLRPVGLAGGFGGLSGPPSGLMRLVLARDARVARVPRLVARVLGLPRAVARGELEEQVLLVDELLARVVRHGVEPRVHADGVAGAGLHAVAAEDAAQLVDDEGLR